MLPYQDLKDSFSQAFSKIKKVNIQLRKLIWFLVLFLGTSGCVYEIQKFLNIYLTYPIVVALEEELESKIEFPAVTVCNLNRVKAEYENCMDFDAVGKYCKDEIDSYIPFMISERRSIVSCSSFSKQYSFAHIRKTLAFFSHYMKMDAPTRKAVGHQISDTIVYCAHNMKICSLDDFGHFQSLRYGNCFTFKINGLKFAAIGYKSGLELVLNVEKEQYTNKIASSAFGMRVSVHNASELPNIEKDGVHISPGFETSISLKQFAIQRLPSPYKDNCLDYNLCSSYSNQVECMKMCLQDQSYKICGCIDPTVVFIQDLKHCNLENKTEVCCLDGIQSQIAKNNSLCDCPVSCYSTSYHRQVSVAALNNNSEFFSGGTGLLESSSDNYAVLKIFYDTLLRQTYKQLPMFSNSEIFSNFGGAMSLWLGISLFSLFEVVDILLAFSRRIY